MEALLDKLSGLRNLLQTQRGGFERLGEERPEGADKIISDYQDISADLDTRIAKISDALNRLKEFNNLYEGYLGWLADAEPRLTKLPTDKDPAVTYANRLAELKVGFIYQLLSSILDIHLMILFQNFNRNSPKSARNKLIT